MPTPIILNRGDTFFWLTVISGPEKIKRHFYYNCICKWGRNILTRGSALASGSSKSCGCLNTTKKKNFLLGYKPPMEGSKIDGKHTVEYMTWRHMKSRCYRKTDHKYKNYGGRGIRICDRWLESFENFYVDMGKRPSHCNSIDRIDVNGNYEPSNCRWATEKEQSVNKTNTIRIIVGGKEIHQAELARMLRVSDRTIHNHLEKGKTGDEIVKYFKTKSNHVATI